MAKGMFVTGRKTVVGVFDLVGAVVDGSSKSIQDVASVGNIYTKDMVAEAQFNSIKNGHLLKAKETALTDALADETFKDKLKEQAKASILEDFEF